MHVPVYLMKGGIIQILLSFLCEQKFLLQLSDNEAIQKKRKKTNPPSKKFSSGFR